MYKKLSPGLKAKAALEAFRKEKALSQTVSEYGVHPGRISRWKQELLKQAGELFSKTKNSGLTGKMLHPKGKHLLRPSDYGGQAPPSSFGLRRASFALKRIICPSRSAN